MLLKMTPLSLQTLSGGSALPYLYAPDRIRKGGSRQMTAFTANPTTEERVFAILESAAASGQRCPTNPQIAEYLAKSGCRVGYTSVPAFVKKLTKHGQIEVRVYGSNWREVKICVGPSAGKTTMAPPHGGQPYLVLSAAGRTPRRSREDVLSGLF